MKAINKGLAALSAVAVLAAPSAFAGAITFDATPTDLALTATTSGPSAPFGAPTNSVLVSRSVVFPLFVETPGETELMSVVINASSVFSTTLSITNNSGTTPAGFFWGTDAIQSTITPLGNSDQFSSGTGLLSNSGGGVVGPNSTATSTSSVGPVLLESNGLGNVNPGIPGSGLAEFVDTVAGTITITIEALFTVRNTGLFNVGAGNPSASDIVWDWSFAKADESISITYNFEETPVPGSAALLALGLAGFGFSLRARAAKKAA